MQSRKRKAAIQRIVFYLAALCLLTIAVTIGVNGAMLYGMRASIVSVDALSDDADCVLVLGAGVRSDGTPSPMLADRIATSVFVYARLFDLRFPVPCEIRLWCTKNRDRDAGIPPVSRALPRQCPRT